MNMDEQEFFCGDFVTRSVDEETGPPPIDEYGIVQDVDHSSRTCHVKWFRTYKTLGQSR